LLNPADLVPVGRHDLPAAADQEPGDRVAHDTQVSQRTFAAGFSHLPLDRVAKVGANPGKEEVRLDGDFQYGQWRYQLVGACPRDLNGNRLASVGDSRGERCESASTKFQLVTGSRAAQCGPRSFSRTIAARSAGGRAPELLVERDER